MIEALHLGSMLPATLGACCVAGGADRRSPLAWLGMLAMLAAMADTMLLPRPVLAPVVWAALLVALALATALRQRLRPRPTAGGPSDHPVRAMAVHRALQAVLMAGLIVVGSGHHATEGGAHAGHGLPVVLLLGVAALVFAFASGAVALRRGLPPLPRAEAALGATSVALMTLPLLAA
ncbi:hypothetical protein [Leifsonia aquatica]|uniref:hypothetical protein n=1 Tax=Leifsonia aquatica TaxID=144185 RepID=UPI0028AC7280|nr:hypothetical protein [Leifsonia aquatica]